MKASALPKSIRFGAIELGHNASAAPYKLANARNDLVIWVARYKAFIVRKAVR